MSAEPLFRNDAYLKNCTATVRCVGPRGICLDRTVFYPTGGMRNLRSALFFTTRQ
jgi:Ser-tRNA(Ala) deacylase AlaX